MYIGAIRPRVRVERVVASKPQRVAAVFSSHREDSHKAVSHVTQGAPQTPVWLFCTVPPDPETASLCERVYVCANPLRLFLKAQACLWPMRAALAVGAWTARPGDWLLKLSPLLIPPFRALLLNRAGDFLPARPAPVAGHISHAVREAAHNAAVRTGEIAAGLYQLLSHHIWRSGPVTRARDVAGAWTLLALGTLLRLTAYPHRRVIDKVHGDASLHLPATAAAAGSGILHFHQQSPDWDGGAIETLVANSDARFLVWHTGPDPAPVQHLLPLFEDPRTFAVSPQSSYRAWKPFLIPTAGFRVLQPGEVTRLLAPIGSTIVIDLQKLAALGVPRTALPITAWMTIFWKAAAAGWRSYGAGPDAAGQTPGLAPEPDFPAEETAFFLYLAFDGALRALGPRQPLLIRGNVAFTAESRNPSPRLKVLLVSPFLPFPLAHGGAVRIYNLCRALSDRVDFFLIAVREHQEHVDYAKLHQVFRHVRVVDIDRTSPAPPGVPSQAAQQECPSLRACIAEACAEFQPDLVQFEFTHMAALRNSAANVPAILVEHDLAYSLYRQIAEASPTRKNRREYQRWLAFEKRHLREFDSVWTVCQSDRREAIQAGWRDPGRTFSVPNGVDIHRFVPTGGATRPTEILFVGSFRHLPNVRAFEELRSRIMSRVWARIPHATLRVVAGPNYTSFWDASGPLDSRVNLEGFVEDLRPLYAAAAVVVAPLVVSAGTNIKIMEAMACGKPIVSTAKGCAGLELTDGSDLLIRDDPDTFASAVCDLLADGSLRSRLAARARRTVEERFSWTAIAESAWQSYVTLLGRSSMVKSSRAHTAGG